MEVLTLKFMCLVMHQLESLLKLSLFLIKSANVFPLHLHLSVHGRTLYVVIQVLWPAQLELQDCHLVQILLELLGTGFFIMLLEVVLL